MKNNLSNVITIDGPAASGKTSVSRELARRFGWKWVSTGAFYRGLAYVAEKLKVDLDDQESLAKLARSAGPNGRWHILMSDENTKVYLKDEEVTDFIFQENIGMIASKISQYPVVRQALLMAQRDCATNVTGLFAEGRDCGSVVFPEAKIKIYLTARQEDRAKRRALDHGLSVEETIKEQTTRDHQDSNRKAAPLQIPKDAFVVDTTELNFIQVVSLIEDHIKKNLEKK